MNWPKFLINETIYILHQTFNFIVAYLYIPRERNKSEFNRETHKYIFTKIYLMYLYIAQKSISSIYFCLNVMRSFKFHSHTLPILPICAYLTFVLPLFAEKKNFKKKKGLQKISANKPLSSVTFLYLCCLFK